MNIKIKASGVYCLIGDDYDKTYMALKRQLGEGEEQIFTERTPGHEYLQWNLPGDGWKALSECDPLMEDLVRKELYRRSQLIISKFGANQLMAQKVLSYPDDSYVFYKADDSGQVVIKLTAWGYRYPERIGEGPATGFAIPTAKKEPVVIKLMYDGAPMPEKDLKLNGFLRTTDRNGILEVGNLPVGYQFDVEADKVREHVVVTMGQEELVLDLTDYAMVEVKAFLNDRPYDGAQVDIRYGGRNLQLVCDGDGQCVTKLPVDLSQGECVVSVDGQTRQSRLDGPVTLFRFDIEKLKGTEPPIQDLLMQRRVEVKIRENGMPGCGLPVTMLCDGELRTLHTDENGIVQTIFVVADDRQVCTVNFANEQQQQTLTELLTLFEFDIVRPLEDPKRESEIRQQALIEVRALLNGRSYAGAPVRLQYKGQESVFQCDEKGFLSTSMPFEDSEELCYVSVASEVQKRQLQSGVNKFDFDLHTVLEPEASPTSRWRFWLLAGLFALLIGALVVATYLFGANVLFG